MKVKMDAMLFALLIGGLIMTSLTWGYLYGRKSKQVVPEINILDSLMAEYDTTVIALHRFRRTVVFDGSNEPMTREQMFLWDSLTDQRRALETKLATLKQQDDE